MLNVDAVILASGLSERMGAEKLLLPFGNTTVLEFFLSRFPFSFFKEVFLISSETTAALVENKFPLTIRVNALRNKGKSHAIRLGAKLSTAQDGVLFSVADQPLLEEKTIIHLLNTFSQKPDSIIIPRAEGKPRNPVVFPANLRNEFQQLRGDEGGKVIIEKNRTMKHFVDFTSIEQFFDLDTPEKYQKLLAIFSKTT